MMLKKISYIITHHLVLVNSIIIITIMVYLHSHNYLCTYIYSHNLDKNQDVLNNRHIKFTIKRISSINRNVINIIQILLTINRINFINFMITKLTITKISLVKTTIIIYKLYASWPGLTVGQARQIIKCGRGGPKSMG